MRQKFTILMWAILVAMGTGMFSVGTVSAQENEPVVVDEVIAQVNNEVITLSMLKREMRDAIQARASGAGISEQQATQEITSRQAELIASLINEQLLVQKGKELNYADEVEAEVNKRMLDVARQQSIATIAELDAAMTANGLNPAEIRQTLRTEIMKNMVLSREVDARLFYGTSDVELKRYFEAHKDKFRKPESVTISEIFLSTNGKTDAEAAQIRAKALQIVTQARGAGADFGALAVANSDRERNGARTAPQDKGKVGAFSIPDLNQEIATAIKTVKAGGVTDPITVPGGIEILRVDERTPASGTAVYNENQVREEITRERADGERSVYMQNLRNDAYIKIAPTYRDAVLPLLKIGTPATAATTTPASVTTSNKSSKPATTNSNNRP